MSMDEIFTPRHPNTTQIDNKFEEFRFKLLNIYQTAVVSTNDLKRAIDFKGNPEDFESLDSSISLEHLAHPADLSISDFDPSKVGTIKRSPCSSLPKEASKLKTVEKLMAQVGVFSESHHRRYTKYNKHRYIRICVDNSDPDILPVEEVLIVVRVYDPFVSKNNGFSRQIKLRQRFTVLGSQTLTELRDRIYCQCSFGPFYDISEDPKQQPFPDARKPFDHGFFFIHDTFYNDTRHPTCDYSEPIREWAKGQDNVGDFKIDSMEHTTFGQLEVQLGSPCVYQHHGNCEHVFTFSDIRLISPGDPRNRKDYPCLDLISIPLTTLCMTCGELEAAKIVCGSTIHMHDPAYLCDECFDAFHYVNGEKVGEFTAYRFMGSSDISK